MNEEVRSEMARIAQEHVEDSHFQQLLLQYLEDKWKTEESIWSDITRSCHGMFGGNSPDIAELAAVTELLILTLDIVDDLQDQDNLEKPWMKTPLPLALNAVLAFIFSLIHSLSLVQMKYVRQDPNLMKDLTFLILRSVNGQYTDLTDTIESDNDYMRMVNEKSGALMRLAFRIGFIGLQLNPDVRSVMDDLAGCVGIMAQLQNDIKDVQRIDFKSDILHKRRTLPCLFLLNHSDELFPLFKQYYEDRASREQLLEAKNDCIQFVENSGCVEYSLVVQTLYHNKAVELFDSVQTHSPWDNRFKELALDPFRI